MLATPMRLPSRRPSPTSAQVWHLQEHLAGLPSEVVLSQACSTCHSCVTVSVRGPRVDSRTGRIRLAGMKLEAGSYWCPRIARPAPFPVSVTVASSWKEAADTAAISWCTNNGEASHAETTALWHKLIVDTTHVSTHQNRTYSHLYPASTWLPSITVPCCLLAADTCAAAGGRWVGDVAAYSGRSVAAYANSTDVVDMVFNLQISCWGGQSSPPDQMTQVFRLFSAQVRAPTLPRQQSARSIGSGFIGRRFTRQQMQIV